MAAVANNPAFAKKAGISQNVGSDFIKADKGHKFAKGGDTMATTASKLFKGKETYKEELAEGKAIKSGKISPQQYARGEGKEEKDMKKMANGGATDPRMAMMASRGAPAARPAVNPRAAMLAARLAGRGAPAAPAMKKGGDVKKYAKGGSIDGIAQRGKTQAKQITMKKGGKC